MLCCGVGIALGELWQRPWPMRRALPHSVALEDRILFADWLVLQFVLNNSRCFTVQNLYPHPHGYKQSRHMNLIAIYPSPSVDLSFLGSKSRKSHPHIQLPGVYLRSNYHNRLHFISAVCDNRPSKAVPHGRGEIHLIPCLSPVYPRMWATFCRAPDLNIELS